MRPSFATAILAANALVWACVAIYVAFGGDWQHALAAGVAGFFCAMLAYEITSRP